MTYNMYIKYKLACQWFTKQYNAVFMGLMNIKLPLVDYLMKWDHTMDVNRGMMWVIWDAIGNLSKFIHGLWIPSSM